ncbi:MAG: flagellar biosynthesis protein FlhF [Thermoanaerobacterales bacterium]|jgi:flagellar biosynthesis protein FlhF|nr:flagellar biosynthesis protein FlhF [Thermoanaerobacterales bacterium]
MKIRTYVADNVQEAFYKVKSDMGKDALILQTKWVKKGGFLGLFSKTMVEVVAANDINVKKEQTQRPMSRPVLPNIERIQNKFQSEDLENIRSDINEVKQMLYKLHDGQKRVADGTFSLPTKFSDFYGRMISNQVDTKIARDIISSVIKALSKDTVIDDKNIYNAVKNEISDRIGCTSPIDLVYDGCSVVAFVGPTGVGKTTTIAKLASHFALYQGKEVAMITADTFRVGAIEQLKLYGELLGVPVRTIYNFDDTKKIMEELKSYDLLLIDTTGTSPNNKLQIRKTKGLLEALAPTDVYMVISAATKGQDICQILNNYKEMNYNKLLITKLDETNTYGPILNAIEITKCPLSYITSGQNVPDDIEIASSEKIAEMILGGIKNV